MENPSITVCNICGAFSIGETDINLHELAGKLANAFYNPKRLPALIIRKSSPKGTVLLFKNGKLLIMGVGSLQNLEYVANKVKSELRKLLMIKKMVSDKVRVTNIMAICDLHFQINMGKLSEDRKSIHNDMMPGILYQLNGPIKKALVHKSGKVTLVGGRTMDDIQESSRIIRREMLKYQFLKGQNSIYDQETID